MIMHSAEQVVATNIALVTLPAVYCKVKQVVDDPDTTAMDLARVIAADPAMTARLLKLVNSAFWGMRGRVESVSRAVSLLGMLQVHDLVLAASVAAAFDRVQPKLMDVARFWRGSVARALAATALAREAGLSDLGRVFTEALLSDIGHMVLYRFAPELTSRARLAVADEPWRLAAEERAIIGCDYAEVGGELADTWALPACFGGAIRHQCNPAGTREYALEASFLHIAGMLAEHLETRSEGHQHLAAITPEAWQVTGLTSACLSTALDQVASNLSATIRNFGLTAD